MFVLLIKYKGVWHYRCKDRQWRVDPWHGSYGECMKVYKTVGSAKRAFSRILNNSTLTTQTETWITCCNDQTCAELWQRVRNNQSYRKVTENA